LDRSDDTSTASKNRIHFFMPKVGYDKL